MEPAREVKSPPSHTARVNSVRSNLEKGAYNKTTTTTPKDIQIDVFLTNIFTADLAK